MSNITQQDQQKILNDLELSIKKLITLLKDSTMPEEIKESWIALLPEMTIEQIDRLLNILEAKYLDEQTRGIDEKLQEEIEQAILNFKPVS